MKKAIILILLLYSLQAEAQTMRELFINMPDSIISLLTRNSRLDLADFIDAGMKAKVTNIFEGETILDTLTNDYLLMRTTQSSTVQLKRLPLTDSTSVICMAQTVCAESCDSRVRFFTVDWEELPQSDYITLPTQHDFWLPADSTNAQTVTSLQQAIDMTLVLAEFSSKSTRIRFTFTTPLYMDREWQQKARPYLHKSIDYEWKEKKFVRQFTNKQ